MWARGIEGGATARPANGVAPVSDYLGMFLDETREHLQAWSDGMLRLEQASDPGVLATIFRAAHTIKGMAMTMGFARMGEITHRAENLLDDVRSGRLDVDGALVDTLLAMLDELEALLVSVADTGMEPGDGDRRMGGAPDGAPAVAQGAAQTEVAAARAGVLSDAPAAGEAAAPAGPDAPAAADGASDRELARRIALSAMEAGRRVYEICIGFSAQCVMPMARFAQILQQLDQDNLLLTIPEAAVLDLGEHTGDVTLVLADTRDAEEIGAGMANISDEIVVRSMHEWHADEGEVRRRGVLPGGRLTEDRHVVHVVEAALAKPDIRVFEVGIRLPSATVLKSARVYLVFEAIGGQDHLLFTRPTVAEIEAEQFGADILFVMWTRDDLGTVRQALDGVSQVELVELREWTSSDGVARQGANVVAARGNGPGPRRGSATVRVDVDKLDALMNLFSEIAIDKTRFESLAGEMEDQRLTETVTHMSRAVNQLQELIMSIRMIPVSSVFQRFPRMVRDTARQLDKDIAFAVSGEETELDRMVVEELADPLMHLLRNSLDHGVESAATRRRNGKPAQGHIWLRAYSSGNRVLLEVEDDGGGIDRAKVLRKARERGLVKDGEDMTDQQVYHLLFVPGFSTADQVSDLSGRGVGLDVVQAKIQSLSGKVEIESTPGVGTRFTVILPVTLALLPSIMVEIDGHPFAVPLTAVEEIQTEPATERVGAHEVVTWRDKTTPVARARRIFGLPEPEQAGYALILSRGKGQVALIVDAVTGQREVVVKPLPQAVKDHTHIGGATILGDGEVALILDPAAF